MSNTVVIGGGIIGCATAYYLSESGSTRPESIHIVEASPELFASASGKAGGFLASHWFAPSTASLGALSFRLHKELAEKNGGHKRWGYSRCTGTSLTEDSRVGGPRGDDWLRHGGSRAEVAGVHEFDGENDGPAWLTRRNGQSVEIIAEDGSVAQVDPMRLSRYLLGESLDRRVRLHQHAKPISVSTDADGNLTSIRISSTTEDGKEEDIPCTRLLLAAGAWTGQVFKSLFPSSTLRLPISHLAGHSIVVRSPRWTAEHETKGCHAIFTTLPGSGFSPEIFSRIGSEIYIAGLNDPSLALPELATDAKVRQDDIEQLKKVAQRLLGQDGTNVSDLEVVREGLCFRPVTQKGSPILARVPDARLGGMKTRGGGEGGVFVAAGHGPWGISHSLGTGMVMAEMVEGKATSANVKGLGF